MQSEYLQRLFLDDDLARGRFPVDGKPVSLGDIRGPLFVVGTEADHIAPWRSVYKLLLLNEHDATFVLTVGGHNAGIVSEPGHPHRRYRIRERPMDTPYIGPDDWMDLAELRDGSWWQAWHDWLDRHSSDLRPPPAFGAAGYPPVDDAPGRYVHEH